MKQRRVVSQNEQGFFTIWILGLSVALLFVGVLMVDFWHVFSVHQNLNEVADGAAVVGSQQVDTQYFEDNGTVVLLTDPDPTNPQLKTVGEAVCTYLSNNTSDPNYCADNPGAYTLIPDPAIPGKYSGVKVSLSQNVNYMAMRVLPSPSGGFSRSFTVTASATSDAQQLNP